MDPYNSDPRVQRAAHCPSCGHLAEAGTGARSICISCGASWQVEPVEVPADRAVLDVLEARALPVDQLRRYLRGGSS